MKKNEERKNKELAKKELFRLFRKNNRVELKNHYGELVWTNTFMDALRKKECLCLNCEKMKECEIARALYVMCQDDNLALAMTRCKHWKDRRYENGKI